MKLNIISHIGLIIQLSLAILGILLFCANCYYKERKTGSHYQFVYVRSDGTVREVSQKERETMVGRRMVLPHNPHASEDCVVKPSV
jgi:hypothetical protein